MTKCICPECKQEFEWAYGVTCDNIETEETKRCCSWICAQVFEFEQRIKEIEA
jgi:hypothetical protein